MNVDCINIIETQTFERSIIMAKGGHKKSHASKTTETKKQPEVLENKKDVAVDDTEDMNSGFGEYMRSGEGMAMMKLFVIGNTVILFVTMAWPNIQQTFEILRDFYYGIWKMINDYFGKEFKMYIAEELKNNKRLQNPLEKLRESEESCDAIAMPINEKIINSWNKMDTITPTPPNAWQNDENNEISIKDESNEFPLNEMSCSECSCCRRRRVNGIGSTSEHEQNPSDDNFVCDDIMV